MDAIAVTRFRSQLGQALEDWVSSPEMSFDVSASSWYLLTGFPTADANVALVHQDDASALSKISEQVEKMAVPIQGSRALCARPTMSAATSLRCWLDRSRGVELSNPKTACAIMRADSGVSFGRTS